MATLSSDSSSYKRLELHARNQGCKNPNLGNSYCCFVGPKKCYTCLGSEVGPSFLHRIWRGVTLSWKACSMQDAWIDVSMPLSFLALALQFSLTNDNFDTSFRRRFGVAPEFPRLTRVSSHRVNPQLGSKSSLK